jgi:hypothetical protein
LVREAAEGKRRYVVVRRRADGMTEDLTSPSFNARTRVHEYGGGAVLIRDGVVYFSNFDDQKLYRLQAGEAVPQPIGQSPGCRYADAVLDAARQRIVCVREDHSGPGEAVSTIVALRANGSGPEAVLASANDLYSNPRLSPDGQQLGWLTWNHPHMPWVSTELWVAKLDAAGAVTAAPRLVAGSGTESLFQPEWSPEGMLRAPAPGATRLSAAWSSASAFGIGVRFQIKSFRDETPWKEVINIIPLFDRSLGVDAVKAGTGPKKVPELSSQPQIPILGKLKLIDNRWNSRVSNFKIFCQRELGERTQSDVIGTKKQQPSLQKVYGVDFAQNLVEAVGSGTRRSVAAFSQKSDRQIPIGVFVDSAQGAAQPRGKKPERYTSENFLYLVLGNRIGRVSNFLRRRVAGQTRRFA